MCTMCVSRSTRYELNKKNSYENILTDVNAALYFCYDNFFFTYLLFIIWSKLYLIENFRNCFSIEILLCECREKKKSRGRQIRTQTLDGWTIVDMMMMMKNDDAMRGWWNLEQKIELYHWFASRSIDDFSTKCIRR